MSITNRIMVIFLISTNWLLIFFRTCGGARNLTNRFRLQCWRPMQQCHHIDLPVILMQLAYLLQKLLALNVCSVMCIYIVGMKLCSKS